MTRTAERDAPRAIEAHVHELDPRFGSRFHRGERFGDAQAPWLGVAAAHDSSIIHRDIKPEDIFCTSFGAVKVLDLGALVAP